METQPTYNCSQEELYEICKTGWNSCSEFLPDFNNLKPKYTTPFITDKLNNVELAENLPNEQQRNEVSETLRIQLAAQNVLQLAIWQKLKRYIIDAYPQEIQKPKLEAAGQNDYAKAANENWQSANALYKQGLKFINDNFTTLTDNDNMPPTFKTTFEDGKTEFDKLHQKFIDAEENQKVQANEKLEANNLIHNQLMSMFLDGQQIFLNKPAIKDQFTFDKVLELISGVGTQGIKGKITNDQNTLPIPEATIAIKNSTLTTTTDSQGSYHIYQMAQGTYIALIQAPGFQDKTITTIEIKKGTITTLNATLIPNP
jgi:hypothetical protein